MINDILEKLGIKNCNASSYVGEQINEGFRGKFASFSPVDGKEIGQLFSVEKKEYDQVVKTSLEAFEQWRKVPAPKRGEVVRLIGEKLREHKDDLGALVSYEMGKSLQEGLGEVQEMIDIADFAVGLSRQLYGLTMHSERPNHRMYEQYHPLGVVGIISAFNFPVAVWAWNSFLAWVCGDVCIWKPSEKAPWCAIACQRIVSEVIEEAGYPAEISAVVLGGAEVGEMISSDTRIPLVSATGSTRMGKIVAQTVAGRLGKSLLELGGNNAVIVGKEANLNIAVNALLFGAVGTCGQRCTTTRRAIIHEDVYDQLINSLSKAYGQLKIGNPLDEKNHVGPLIDQDAVVQYKEAVELAKSEGGNVLVGAEQLSGDGYESDCYVRPVLIEAKNDFAAVQKETFAPILYLMKYSSIEQAIKMQNDVPQGLSSSIITDSVKEAELFLSVKGSDCGIANVNIGTSGAEIGGAFGGEKETGGGRESGSDSWKIYMRRQTNTINYGSDLPLAQGIKFDL